MAYYTNSHISIYMVSMVRCGITTLKWDLNNLDQIRPPYKFTRFNKRFLRTENLRILVSESCAPGQCRNRWVQVEARRSSAAVEIVLVGVARKFRHAGKRRVGGLIQLNGHLNQPGGSIVIVLISLYLFSNVLYISIFL